MTVTESFSFPMMGSFSWEELHVPVRQFCSSHFLAALQHLCFKLKPPSTRSGQTCSDIYWLSATAQPFKIHAGVSPRGAVWGPSLCSCCSCLWRCFLGGWWENPVMVESQPLGPTQRALSGTQDACTGFEFLVWLWVFGFLSLWELGWISLLTKPLCINLMVD